MDPRRLKRVQPWAFHRQPGDDHPHAALTRVHLLIVEADPRADRLTCMPRGVIPDAQQRGEAVRRQAVAAPGQQVGRHGADGAPRHTPEPHLLGRRQQAADQQPITCQGVRLGIALGTRQFLESGDRLSLIPTMLRGLSQAAPPDFIGKAERPRRMRSGQPDQAVAPLCFLRSAGSGLVSPWLARFQRTPKRLSARRIASPLTWRDVRPWASLTSAANARVQTRVDRPYRRGRWCHKARRRSRLCVSKTALGRWGLEEVGWRVLIPRWWMA